MASPRGKQVFNGRLLLPFNGCLLLPSQRQLVPAQRLLCGCSTADEMIASLRGQAEPAGRAAAAEQRR